MKIIGGGNVHNTWEDCGYATCDYTVVTFSFGTAADTTSTSKLMMAGEMLRVMQSTSTQRSNFIIFFVFMENVMLTKDGSKNCMKTY